MPIPDFQSLMLPLLKLVSDGREHSFRESIDQLAGQFHLIVISSPTLEARSC